MKKTYIILGFVFLFFISCVSAFDEYYQYPAFTEGLSNNTWYGNNITINSIGVESIKIFKNAKDQATGCKLIQHGTLNELANGSYVANECIVSYNYTNGVSYNLMSTRTIVSDINYSSTSFNWSTGILTLNDGNITLNNRATSEDQGVSYSYSGYTNNAGFYRIEATLTGGNFSINAKNIYNNSNILNYNVSMTDGVYNESYTTSDGNILTNQLRSGPTLNDGVVLSYSADYWTLSSDEPNEILLTDLSGNGNTGNFTGLNLNNTKRQGVSVNSNGTISFDGTNDYTTFSESLLDFSGDFYMSFNFTPDGGAGYQIISSKYKDVGGSRQLLFYYFNGGIDAITATTGGDSCSLAPVPITDGVSSNVGLGFNGTTCFITLNGVVESSDTFDGALIPGGVGTFTGLGASGDGANNPSNFLNGSLSSARVWNESLTVSEMVAEMNSNYPIKGNNLLMSLEFYDYNSTDLYDTKFIVNDSIGKAFYFDGVNDIITFDYLSTISPLKNFSINGIMHPTNSGGTHNLFYLQNSSSNRFALDYGSNNLKGALYDGGSYEFSEASGGIVVNTASSFIYGYKTGNGNLFINGINQTGTTGVSIGNTNVFVIGARAGSSLFYEGSIRNPLIHNRFLNVTESEDLSSRVEKGEGYPFPARLWNITFSSTNYFGNTYEWNISENLNATLYPYTSVYAKNAYNNNTIYNYTINYNSSNYTTTSAVVFLPLYNETSNLSIFNINDSGTLYTYDSANVTANLYLNTHTFYLYPNPSVLEVNLFNADTGAVITDNVTIQAIGGNISTSTTTINGTAYISNLVTGIYTIRFISDNFTTSDYQQSIGENSFHSLSVYLFPNATDLVTFTTRDKSSGVVKENAVYTMETIVNDTLKVVGIKLSDLAGQVNFNYETDKIYTFTVILSGYETKSFQLGPSLNSEYNVWLNALTQYNITDAFSNIGLSYLINPTLAYNNISLVSNNFYDNASNNFTFTIIAPEGDLLNYGLTLTYKNITSTATGINSNGETLSLNLNISGASITDEVYLTYNYTSSLSGYHDFNNKFIIVQGLNAGLISNLKNETYGLGIFERVFIVIVIAGIFGGLIGLFSGTGAGGVAITFIFGYFVYNGFLEIWFVALPIVLIFIYMVKEGGG